MTCPACTLHLLRDGRTGFFIEISVVKRYDTDMQYVSQSTQDTQAIAAKLAQKIRAKMTLAGATIVALREI